MSVLTKQTNTNLQPIDSQQPLLPNNSLPPIMEGANYAENEISLLDILGILKKRKLTIIVTLLTTVGIALAFTLSAKSTYRANAIIQIEREGAEIVSFGKTNKPNGSFSSENDPFFRTRYEMLKGRVIAQKVINELDLFESLAPSKKKTTSNASSVPIDYTQIFSKNLLVQPIDGTHLVEIYYEAPSAVEAKNVVFSLLDNFIRLQIESKSQTGEYAKEFLGTQLQDAKIRLQSSEKALVNFANSKGILGIDEKQTRQVKKLENLDDALVKAKINRIEAESLYLQIQKSGSVSALLNNTVINSLKSRLVQFEGEHLALLKSFKPNHPRVENLQNQIKSIRSKLKQEKRNIQRSMKANFLAAKKQEESINDELSRFNQEVNGLQNNSVDYNSLKREVESNRKIVNNLSQRHEEVNVASAANISSITVVEPAVTPINRYRPKPKLNIMLGLLSGLILGLGFAFLRESLDKTIRSAEDLARISGFPVLGKIPSVKSPAKKELEMITSTDPNSPVAEAYRVLATNIRLLLDKQEERILLVTSVNPGEGKSISATNIACTYAQMGKKVLIIDADIRHASLHETLGLDNKRGLTHYLKGESDLVGITQPVMGIQGLFGISAGDSKVDPVSLLSHERMSFLTSQGGTIFDYVIIDAPAVAGYADTLVLSSLATSTLIVTKEDTMEAGSIKQTLEQIRRIKNNVFGFLVVNVKNMPNNTNKNTYKKSESVKNKLLEKKKVNYA
ncbi:MAG: polysaccharide biosynthesis tyrosine autokinase [Cocleimonas sp.]